MLPGGCYGVQGGCWGFGQFVAMAFHVVAMLLGSCYVILGSWQCVSKNKIKETIKKNEKKPPKQQQKERKKEKTGDFININMSMLYNHT